MTTPPIIGISCYDQQAQWGSWDLPANLLPRRYADKIVQAGGVPVLLPPVEHVTAALSRLDGLVLSGGGDVDPARYGAVPDPESGTANQVRDGAEIELSLAALDSGLPLLGICRGLQVINVTLGGTLHQHLPALVGHDGHSPDPARYGSHKVSVAPGTQLAAALGASEAAVPTHHHQAADRLGEGLIATAWSDDGVIEAFEFGPGGGHESFMIAVQWHPEVGEDLSLFTALIDVARRPQ
jgi:putative glutamine amidotransferase